MLLSEGTVDNLLYSVLRNSFNEEILQVSTLRILMILNADLVIMVEATLHHGRFCSYYCLIRIVIIIGILDA